MADLSEDWQQFIQFADQRLARSRLKTQQLECLLATLKARAAAGEPCPTRIEGLTIDLGTLLAQERSDG